eukprot:3166000-Rhodomonas_salina.1
MLLPGPVYVGESPVPESQTVSSIVTVCQRSHESQSQACDAINSDSGHDWMPGADFVVWGRSDCGQWPGPRPESGPPLPPPHRFFYSDAEWKLGVLRIEFQ